MRIGIIVAMEKELSLLLPVIENVKEVASGSVKAYSGKISSHDVVVMKCGIGKVNSALSTDMMIREFHPELIINTGVAGGADGSMMVLDIFIAEKVAYHDVWCGPGTKVGAASGFDVFLIPDENVVSIAKKYLEDKNGRFGLICSGDRFISSEAEVKKIKSEFPECLAVDMESASIAQVCVANNTPFAVIRAISDTPGAAENISQYENFWSDAPVETFSAIVAILKEL